MADLLMSYKSFAQSVITLGSPVALWIVSLIVGVAAAAMLVMYYRDMKTKSRKKPEIFLWLFRILI